MPAPSVPAPTFSLHHAGVTGPATVNTVSAKESWSLTASASTIAFDATAWEKDFRIALDDPTRWAEECLGLRKLMLDFVVSSQKKGKKIPPFISIVIRAMSGSSLKNNMEGVREKVRLAIVPTSKRIIQIVPGPSSASLLTHTLARTGVQQLNPPPCTSCQVLSAQTSFAVKSLAGIKPAAHSPPDPRAAHSIVTATLEEKPIGKMTVSCDMDTPLETVRDVILGKIQENGPVDPVIPPFYQTAVTVSATHPNIAQAAPPPTILSARPPQTVSTALEDLPVYGNENFENIASPLEDNPSIADNDQSVGFIPLPLAPHRPKRKGEETVVANEPGLGQMSSGEDEELSGLELELTRAREERAVKRVSGMEDNRDGYGNRQMGEPAKGSSGDNDVVVVNPRKRRGNEKPTSENPVLLRPMVIVGLHELGNCDQCVKAGAICEAAKSTQMCRRCRRCEVRKSRCSHVKRKNKFPNTVVELNGVDGASAKGAAVDDGTRRRSKRTTTLNNYKVSGVPAVKMGRRVPRRAAASNDEMLAPSNTIKSRGAHVVQESEDESHSSDELEAGRRLEPLEIVIKALKKENLRLKTESKEFKDESLRSKMFATQCVNLCERNALATADLTARLNGWSPKSSLFLGVPPNRAAVPAQDVLLLGSLNASGSAHQIGVTADAATVSVEHTPAKPPAKRKSSTIPDGARSPKRLRSDTAKS